MVDYKKVVDFAQFVAAGARSTADVLAVREAHRRQGPAQSRLEKAVRFAQFVEVGANGVGSLATVRHGQIKAQAPKTASECQEILRDRLAELQTQGVRFSYVDSVPRGLPGDMVHPYGRAPNGHDYVEHRSQPVEVLGQTMQHGYILELDPATRQPVEIMEYVAYPPAATA